MKTANIALIIANVILIAVVVDTLLKLKRTNENIEGLRADAQNIIGKIFR